MQKLIDTVSSFYATGIQPQVKMFKVSSGQYQDRLVIIYPKTSSQLVYVWADPPYLSWSQPVDLATDSADYPVSAHMDAEGNIYIVYTQQTSLSLMELKLSFSQGSWSLGAVNTVCNQGECRYPSIIKDSTDRLWVSWTYYDPVTERNYVHVKTSQDDGTTWGTGPTDPGTCLTNGAASCFSQLLFQSPYIRCFYSDDSTLLAYRSHEIQSTGWDSQETIYSGSQIDDDFCADLSSDNKVGIVFPGSSSLLYKEFDGSNWSGVFTVDNNPSQSPALRFLEDSPYVFFARNIGGGQNQSFYSYRDGQDFVTPVTYEPGQKPFDRFLCYDDSASTKYCDLTTQAEDSNPADVFHPASGGVLEDTDDVLYLGMEVRFNLVRLNLATSGIGGQVKWQYWDGDTWSDFTPQSGAYHLDSQEKTVILWEDLNSVPYDWQRCSVNDLSEFWMRIVVTSSFTTAPVGTQVTAVPESKYLKALI
jgi:hypothetical protein